MTAQEATVLSDPKEDSTEATPEEQIVCRKGHAYMKPSPPTFKHNHCKICKQIRDGRYNRSPEAKYKRYKRELKARIAYKRIRLERILSEQEDSERDGRIQSR